MEILSVRMSPKIERYCLQWKGKTNISRWWCSTTAPARMRMSFWDERSEIPKWERDTEEMVRWKVRKWVRSWIPFNSMCFPLNFSFFSASLSLSISLARSLCRVIACCLASSNFSSLKSNYLTIARVRRRWPEHCTVVCGCVSDAHHFHARKTFSQQPFAGHLFAKMKFSNNVGAGKAKNANGSWRRWWISWFMAYFCLIIHTCMQKITFS